MSTVSKKRYLPAITYVVIWVLMGAFLLLWQPINWQIRLPAEFWYKQGILFVVLILIFYVNTNYWVPGFLFRNRTVRYILINIVTAILVAYLMENVEKQLGLWEVMNKAFKAAREAGSGKRHEDFIDYFSLLISLIVLGISTSLATIQNWRKNLVLQEELKSERINTELQFLKAQINPHFFFNTLNNIYALTQVNVDAAGDAIHKLSRMMRYVLYETQHVTVMLSREIDFVEDYIELMKLRLTDKVQVRFSHPEPLRDVPVAPMIFLPFIENAFKHGISSTKPCFIDIEITQQAKNVQLMVRNTLFVEKKPGLDEGTGIGLVNTRRRLDLLYPGKYDLEVRENKQDAEHVVFLKLNIV